MLFLEVSHWTVVFFYVTAYVLIHQLAKSQDKKWVVYGMAVVLLEPKQTFALALERRKKLRLFNFPRCRSL